jgi:hypothetical protein
MRRGATQVREFFETIYTSVEVRTFEPREFVVGGWAGRIKQGFQGEGTRAFKVTGCSGKSEEFFCWSGVG